MTDPVSVSGHVGGTMLGATTSCMTIPMTAPAQNWVFKMLVVIDEYSRECLAIVVARRLRSDDMMACLADLFVLHAG